MSGGHKPRRAAGELEKATLAALWVAETPLRPSDIHAALGGELAYNTVHTILTRLVDKGLVIRATRPAVAERARRSRTPPSGPSSGCAERWTGPATANSYCDVS